MQPYTHYNRVCCVRKISQAIIIAKVINGRSDSFRHDRSLLPKALKKIFDYLVA